MKDIFSPIFLLCLLLLTIAHATGVYFAAVPPIFYIAFPLALILYYLKKYKFSYLLIALAIALLVTSAFLKEKDDFYNMADLNVPQNEYITIEGKLTNFPEIGREHSVIFLKTDFLEYDRKKTTAAFNIRMKVKGDLRYLNKGDTIGISAKLYRDNLNLNFFANPYENYLLYKGIHFSGYCKSARMVTLLKKTNFVRRFIGRWRNKIRAAIERKYKKQGQEIDKKGVFLEAILIGDRGRVETVQKNELLDAGVYHLLAISGAHIGIIAIFLLFFLRFLGVPYGTRYIAAGIFLVLFLALSGFRISAQRAVLMALLIFTARILYLDIHIYNIISFCGLLILFKNPAEFLDPGFILTFTLTAAIVTGRKVFLPILQKPRFKKIPSYIKELVCANFSASLISLPLSLFFFKRYSFAGFFAGLLLLPLTAVITAIGILLIPLAPISRFMADNLLVIIDLPLRLFFKIAVLFSHIYRFTIFRASPHLFLVILIVALFYLFPVFTDSKKKLHKIFLFVAIFIFIIATLFIILDPLSYKPDRLEVFYLDVGQGDSQVVVFPGGDALLIDGGGAYYSDFETGKQILLPFLLQKRIKIKWVAVSHFHPDHVRGIIEIIEVIKPEELWLSSAAQNDMYYKSLMERVKDVASIEIKKLDSTFLKTIGGCKVECLFPVAFIETRYSHNNHSQVLKVSDGGNSFLFTGDIEKEVEEILVQDSCPRLKADVLKVPHHGSKTSSSTFFLRCAAPGLAIYSYSKNNRFNFPHPQVVENYKAQRVRTLAVASRGGIKITSLPGGIEIETSK
jgi:competence protein ComEC